jgi:hypothetical protein
MMVLLTIRGTPATGLHTCFGPGGTIAGSRGGNGGEEILAFAGGTVRGQIRGTADIHSYFSKGKAQNAVNNLHRYERLSAGKAWKTLETCQRLYRKPLLFVKILLLLPHVKAHHRPHLAPPADRTRP